MTEAKANLKKKQEADKRAQAVLPYGGGSTYREKKLEELQ